MGTAVASLGQLHPSAPVGFFFNILDFLLSFSLTAVGHVWTEKIHGGAFKRS